MVANLTPLFPFYPSLQLGKVMVGNLGPFGIVCTLHLKLISLLSMHLLWCHLVLCNCCHGASIMATGHGFGLGFLLGRAMCSSSL
jgi:hypothetical protein